MRGHIVLLHDICRIDETMFQRHENGLNQNRSDQKLFHKNVLLIIFIHTIGVW